jgi:hypothetical protein
MNLFLLGAGFDIDATQEASSILGNKIYQPRYEIDDADYRIAQNLATADRSNWYREFFNTFSDAPISDL